MEPTPQHHISDAFERYWQEADGDDMKEMHSMALEGLTYAWEIHTKEVRTIEQELCAMEQEWKTVETKTKEVHAHLETVRNTLKTILMETQNPEHKKQRRKKALSLLDVRKKRTTVLKNVIDQEQYATYIKGLLDAEIEQLRIRLHCELNTMGEWAALLQSQMENSQRAGYNELIHICMQEVQRISTGEVMLHSAPQEEVVAVATRARVARGKIAILFTQAATMAASIARHTQENLTDSVSVYVQRFREQIEGLRLSWQH